MPFLLLFSLSCSIIQVVACMYVSITRLHGQTYTTGFNSMKMMMMMMRKTTNQRFYLSTTYHISHENFKCVHIWNDKTQVDLRKKNMKTQVLAKRQYDLSFFSLSVSLFWFLHFRLISIVCVYVYIPNHIIFFLLSSIYSINVCYLLWKQ